MDAGARVAPTYRTFPPPRVENGHLPFRRRKAARRQFTWMTLLQYGTREFFAHSYGGQELTSPFVHELVKAGILTSEGVQEVPNTYSSAAIYRPISRNEDLFRWRGNGENAGFMTCPGKVYIDVVNFTEPAEECGVTTISYRYRVSDIQAAVQALMDSAGIPSGPQGPQGSNTVHIEGEGEVTLQKRHDGWTVLEN